MDCGVYHGPYKSAQEYTDLTIVRKIQRLMIRWSSHCMWWLLPPLRRFAHHFLLSELSGKSKWMSVIMCAHIQLSRVYSNCARRGNPRECYILRGSIRHYAAHALGRRTSYQEHHIQASPVSPSCCACIASPIKRCILRSHTGFSLWQERHGIVSRAHVRKERTGNLDWLV